MGPTDAELVAALGTWLPQRRWYASKGHLISDIRIAARHRLAPGAESVVAAVQIDAGRWQVYQVPLWLAADPHDRSLIGRCGEEYLHDGLAHPEVVTALLALQDPGDLGLDPAGGGPVPSVQWRERWVAGGSCRVLDVEQSNTSVVVGDNLMVKFFRQLSVGTNPDIEVQAALSAVGCRDVGGVLGWISGGWTDPASGRTVHGHLAMIQPYFAESVDGWELACQQVASDVAFGDEAAALGEATARVHRDLRQAFPAHTLTHAEILEKCQRLHARLSAAAATVVQIRPLETALHTRFDAVSKLSAIDVQRVHGDLHLGQFLRTPAGWRMLDFEGEPGGDLDARRILDHPMRDVAGMLRSFAYAAGRSASDLAVASAWRDRCYEAFLGGYVAAGGPDSAAHEALLTAYLIDKAAYEALYEYRNRPDWIGIPLAALRGLAGL